MTKDEALKMALEALHGFIPYLPLNDEAQCGRYDEAITAIKEALAQPEQEPVAFVQGCNRGQWEIFPAKAYQIFENEQPLYITPPQRTWVGLTDEEVDKIYEAHHNQYGECESVNFGYERAIEAKLKEKNT
jgi:hypothetical protein